MDAANDNSTAKIYDYAIIGSGLAGATLLNELLRKGVSPENIVVIEQDAEREVTGSSQGHARIFGRRSATENPTYFQTANRGRELYSEMQWELGEHFLKSADVITIGDATEIRKIEESLRANDVVHSVYDKAPSAIGLVLDEAAGEHMVRETQTTGLLDPAAIISALRKYAYEIGVDSFYRNKVTGWQQDSEGVIDIDTDKGVEVSARAMIVANGLGAPALLPALSPYIHGQPIPLAYFDMPEGFPLKDAVLLLNKNNEIGVFFMPDKIDGMPVIKAGIHDIPTLREESHAPLDTEEDLMRTVKARVTAELKRLYPAWAEQLEPYAEMDVCNYVMTPDEKPLLGKYADNIWVHTGGCGAAAKHEPALSENLAEQMLGLSRTVDCSEFDVSRIAQLKPFTETASLASIPKERLQQIIGFLDFINQQEVGSPLLAAITGRDEPLSLYLEELNQAIGHFGSDIFDVKTKRLHPDAAAVAKAGITEYGNGDYLQFSGQQVRDALNKAAGESQRAASVSR